jgi:kynurenine formamidase
MATMQGEYDFIDLTRPIHTGMPVFPAITKTFLGVYQGHKEVPSSAIFSAQTNILVMSDHAGTHIDAPIHFNPTGTGIDQFPIDLAFGPAVLQDFSFKKSGDVVTVQEVKGKLEGIGVNPKDIKYILFRTGAAELYNTDKYMSYFLEIHVDAVEWMVSQDILVFGVDASTVDRAPGRTTHMFMRKKTCYHIENLANLDKLPQDRIFTFICTPLILKDSSASPIRAVAAVPKKSK